MSFLNPWMLVGITAIGVPIVIHLLNRRRYDRVVWAAMRFLNASVRQNQRRMRLEDILLLLMRCAVLVLLAVALARPAVRGAAGLFARADVAAVILLDNSYSMGQTDGTATRFTKAQEAADQIVGALPAGSSVAVLLASDEVQDLIGEPSYDLAAARRAIHEAQLSDRATDVLPAMRRAFDVLSRRPGSRREVYLITDGQRAGWRQITDVRRAIKDAAIPSFIVLVGADDSRNCAVSDLRFASALAPAGRPLRFEIQITNHGNGEVRGIPVKLAVDGDPPSDQITIDQIPAGESRTTSLGARLRDGGVHTITASIPTDRLAADDQRTIAVRAVEQVNVLIVDGDSGAAEPGNDAFLLRNALVPVSPSEAGTYFIHTRTIGPEAMTNSSLAQYDSVILADVPQVTPPDADALAQYVRQGGGLVVFSGDRAQAAAYNQQLYQRQRLLPAQLGAPLGDPVSRDRFYTLQDRNFEHPLASLWNDPAAGSPSAAHFYRILDLRPDEDRSPDSGASAATKEAPSTQPADAGPAAVVLRYSDGRPAVMERPYGRGRVLLFSSTAGTAWNDMATRTPGVFLPLMYRAIGSIVQRRDEPLNIRVGERFGCALPPQALAKDALVHAPGDPPGVGRSYRVDLVDGIAMLAVDLTERAGAYQVTVDSDVPIAMRFAAQVNPAESDLRPLTTDELDALRQVAEVTNWKGQRLGASSVQGARIGTELSVPLIVAVLLAAGAEMLLAAHFSRPK